VEDWGEEFSFIRRRPCPVWQAPGIMMPIARAATPQYPIERLMGRRRGTANSGQPGPARRWRCDCTVDVLAQQAAMPNIGREQGGQCSRIPLPLLDCEQGWRAGPCRLTRGRTLAMEGEKDGVVPAVHGPGQSGRAGGWLKTTTNDWLARAKSDRFNMGLIGEGAPQRGRPMVGRSACSAPNVGA
jgi:hypothetical protein